MPSPCVIVNVNPDMSLKLASYVAELLGKGSGQTFLSEYEALASKVDSGDASKTSDVISMLLTHSSLIFSTDIQSDIEGFYQALFFILLQFSRNDSANNSDFSVTRIVKAILDIPSSPDVPNLNTNKISTLISLFNIAEELNADNNRYDIFMGILKLSETSPQLAMEVYKFIPYLLEWIPLWKFNGPHDSLLHLVQAIIVLLDAMSKSQVKVYSSSASSAQSLKLRFLLILVRAYEAKDACFNGIVGSAVALSLQLNTPNARRERLELLAALKSKVAGSSNDNVKALFELLSFVCNGSFKNISTYQPTSPVLKTNNIQYDEVVKLMRLAALAELVLSMYVEGTATTSISFKSIADKLNLSVTDDEFNSESSVEYWVVAAMNQGIIEASIDQDARIVRIMKCTYVPESQMEIVSNKCIIPSIQHLEKAFA